MTKFLAGRSAAGLAQAANRVAALVQPGNQALNLHAFAGGFGSFESNEETPHGRSIVRLWRVWRASCFAAISTKSAPMRQSAL